MNLLEAVSTFIITSYLILFKTRNSWLIILWHLPYNWGKST